MMLHKFAKPKTLAFTLLFLSAIPILMSLALVVQIPLGSLPEDAAKFLVIPFWHWFHVLAGASFGLIGPIQFARVLQLRFGNLHKALGRIFIVAGLVLGVSGLGIFAQVPNSSHFIADAMRVGAGAALILTLLLSLNAIRRRDIQSHRNWIIRAYAIGMGAGSVSIVLFPVYIIKGAPIDGLLTDIVFVSSWLFCIARAEFVIVRTRQSAINKLKMSKRPM